MSGKNNFPNLIYDYNVVKKQLALLGIEYRDEDMEEPENKIQENNIRYSIIIPTYNHLNDCLKPCLESMIQYTDFSEIEVIVVANGCTDETEEYVMELGEPFNTISYKESLGYPGAINKGIQRARGEYIILLNNDTIILGQDKNTWINKLVKPFEEDPLTGISGPLKLFDNYAGSDVLIFFCVMIKKELFDRIGLLDESYGMGGGEDISFSMETMKLGYKCVQVPHEGKLEFSTTNCGDFPIFHAGEGTLSAHEFPEYGQRIIKENGFKNLKKYNQHIKLNLGSGGIEIPGYISLDKFDTRAHILMDACNLELDDNTVEELIAIHLFEHINPYKAAETLQHWFSKLKPGGKLIMEMPNIEELCKDFVNASKEDRYGILNSIYCPLNTQNDEIGHITSLHAWGWYPEILYDHLVGAGYENIVLLPEQFPHPCKNFRAECNKPMGA
jgi:glycosyltransferase involved in cell wall biosynthesis